MLRRCNSHSSLLLNVVFLNYPLRSLPAVKMNACPTHSHHTMVDNFESRNQTESHTESQEASRIGHKSDDGNFLVSFDACDHWILKRENRKKCFYFQNSRPFYGPAKYVHQITNQSQRRETSRFLPPTRNSNIIGFHIDISMPTCKSMGVPNISLNIRSANRDTIQL